jgi:hypothetical protein
MAKFVPQDDQEAAEYQRFKDLYKQAEEPQDIPDEPGQVYVDLDADPFKNTLLWDPSKPLKGI